MHSCGWCDTDFPRMTRLAVLLRALIAISTVAWRASGSQQPCDGRRCASAKFHPIPYIRMQLERNGILKQKGGIPESKLQVTTHQGSDADSLAFTGRNLNEYDYQYEYVELYDGTGEDLETSADRPARAAEYTSVFVPAPAEFIVDGRDKDMPELSGDKVLDQSDDLVPYYFDADQYYFQEYSEVWDVDHALLIQNTHVLDNTGCALNTNAFMPKNSIPLKTGPRRNEESAEPFFFK